MTETIPGGGNAARALPPLSVEELGLDELLLAPTDAPIKVTGLHLRLVDTEEGIEFHVLGRGEPVCTYSVTLATGELERRLTSSERVWLADSRYGVRDVVRSSSWDRMGSADLDTGQHDAPVAEPIAPEPIRTNPDAPDNNDEKKEDRMEETVTNNGQVEVRTCKRFGCDDPPHWLMGPYAGYCEPHAPRAEHARRATKPGTTATARAIAAAEQKRAAEPVRPDPEPTLLDLVADLQPLARALEAAAEHVEAAEQALNAAENAKLDAEHDLRAAIAKLAVVELVEA
jgi:hypothetical protein